MKKTFLALALAASLFSSSCLGPNRLYNTVANWNAEVTEQDWLNEIIFLALHIIPVYGIAMLGDYVVFNTIDYWGDENPIDDPGQFPMTWGK